MTAKWAQVRKLLDEGYDLADVDSDHGALEATFRRAGRTVRVRFGRHEAAELLLMRPRS